MGFSICLEFVLFSCALFCFVLRKENYYIFVRQLHCMLEALRLVCLILLVAIIDEASLAASLTSGRAQRPSVYF